MDRIKPSEGFDTGSIPVENTIYNKKVRGIEREVSDVSEVNPIGCALNGISDRSGARDSSREHHLKRKQLLFSGFYSHNFKKGMYYKKIADNFDIPVIGIGTWKMWGELEPVFENDEEDIRALRKSIELGMTHIDTAEIYGGGHSEELVGAAIKGFDRSKLFITTKVAKRNCAYEDVLRALDESLKRLGTDYVDLYLIHAPNEEISIAETMKAMDILVQEGKTRLIGVSNFTVEQIQEAQKYSENRIVANQIEYNLAIRNNERYTPDAESEIIPYCQKNDILIIAYRPINRGELLGSENVLLGELAAKYQKTPAQIAINWLIAKKGVVTIPKASNIRHIEENLGAMGWEMDPADIKRLGEWKPGSTKNLQ